MRLSNILRNLGLFSNDIKARIKSGQIEINGEKIREDVEINNCIFSIPDARFKSFENPNIFEAGDFLCKHILTNKIWKLQCQTFGIEALWNFDNDLSKFFSDFLFLKVSKRQMFILRKI